MADEKRPSPNFFTRDGDGSVRLRLRFNADAAALIEEAAGDTPIIPWVYETLREAARQQSQQARRRRPPVGPPEQQENDPT